MDYILLVVLLVSIAVGLILILYGLRNASKVVSDNVKLPEPNTDTLWECERNIHLLFEVDVDTLTNLLDKGHSIKSAQYALLING